MGWLKNKIYFISVALVGYLIFFGYVAVGPVEAGDNPPGNEIRLTPIAPEPHSLTLVSFSPLVVENEIVGAVAIYDDPTTKRPVDYSEFYDSDGDLLAFDWFDRFGIERMAVDRGLVEDEDKLEGVFVLVSQGDSV